MKYSPKMEAERHQSLHSLSLSCSRLPVSPGKELVHSSGTLIFVAVTQGTLVDYLALVASRAYAHRSHRTIINRECLTSYHPKGTTAMQKIEVSSLLVKA